MNSTPLTIPAEVKAELEAGALFVVNHSGGKDSQAMTIALRDLIPAAQVLVVHAELPGADWEGIPEHIESTIPAAWGAVNYCRAVHADGSEKTFRSMVEARAAKRPDAPAFPSPALRQCTSDLKRGPIAKAVRHFLKAHPEFKGRVVHCIGVRAGESASRAKAASWKRNGRESVAGREVFEWLPIHDWQCSSDTRAPVNPAAPEVFDVIESAGQAVHWAYKAGMSRLSCCFCIMASRSDLCTAAKLKPELYRQYVELERQVGSTMNMNGKGLEEVTGIPVELEADEDADELEAARRAEKAATAPEPESHPSAPGRRPSAARVTQRRARPTLAAPVAPRWGRLGTFRGRFGDALATLWPLAVAWHRPGGGKGGVKSGELTPSSRRPRQRAELARGPPCRVA